MPAQLSKLQIRLIQTHNSCEIQTASASVKCDKLYLLSKSSFYLAPFEATSSVLYKDILEKKEIRLTFGDKKDSLVCVGTALIISKDHEDFEDASDFLAVNASKLEYVIEFTVERMG